MRLSSGLRHRSNLKPAYVDSIGTGSIGLASVSDCQTRGSTFRQYREKRRRSGAPLPPKGRATKGSGSRIRNGSAWAMCDAMAAKHGSTPRLVTMPSAPKLLATASSSAATSPCRTSTGSSERHSRRKRNRPGPSGTGLSSPVAGPPVMAVRTVINSMSNTNRAGAWGWASRAGLAGPKASPCTHTSGRSGGGPAVLGGASSGPPRVAGGGAGASKRGFNG